MYCRQVGDSVHLNVTSVARDVGVCVSRPTSTIRTTMDAHASNMPHLVNAVLLSCKLQFFYMHVVDVIRILAHFQSAFLLKNSL